METLIISHYISAFQYYDMFVRITGLMLQL